VWRYLCFTSWFYWDVAQQWVIVCYRCFGKTYRPYLQGQPSCLTANRRHATSQCRTKTSIELRPKPEISRSRACSWPGCLMPRGFPHLYHANVVIIPQTSPQPLSYLSFSVHYTYSLII
jgi:hypothetical protein